MKPCNERIFHEDKMYDFIEKLAEERNLQSTEKALKQMAYFHKGQTRRGPERIPYVNHPLTMACQAVAFGLCDDNILATILLHDVVEDCNVTVEELGVNEEIGQALTALTFYWEPGMDYKETKREYFSKVAENKTASIVKALDRCHNISLMATGFSRKRMIEYIEETEDMLMPILSKLGEESSEYRNMAFLLKYQIRSVIETVKNLI